MMFVDTSAIVAIIAGEPEAESLARDLAAATRRTTSPVVTLETSIVLASKLDIAPSQALALFEEFLAEANVSVIPITEQIGRMALETLAQFGKGRHPARLNLADCLSYACARAQGAGLLFKGDDFSKTDIETGAR
jgi:ribonuclease VapC